MPRSVQVPVDVPTAACLLKYFNTKIYPRGPGTRTQIIGSL